jgi:hypothetical protein
MASLFTGQASGTKTTEYPSTNTGTLITAASVCNGTAGAESFSLWVTRGGTEALVYSDEPVAAGAGFGLDRLVAQHLDSGDSIAIQASTGATLDFVISGDRG